MNSEKLPGRRALLLAFVCTALFAFLASASAVRAQAGDDAAYKELIEQALSEFKHKNWPEARVLFMRAHEQNPNARTLRGMGVVSFEMRDYPNALINLQAALEDTRQPLTEAQRKECEGLLARVRTYVGVYTLKLDPADARVLLDGVEPMRDEQGHLLVSFGEHTLLGSAPGREETTLKLQVQGGERGEIALSLPPERASEALVAPVAAVTAGAAAQSSPAPAPSTKQPLRTEPKGFLGHGLKYSWVTLGFSAAAGGAAAAFWVVGQNKLDSLDDECAGRAQGSDPCTRDNTSTNKIETFELMTNVAIGVAAASLVTTAVLMGLEWPRERQLALHVGPTSLALRGKF